MRDLIRKLMPPDAFKGLLIDLEDRSRAAAQQAHTGVRNNFKLSAKRARALEGQARFRLLEEGFEEVCTLHGGKLLPSGVIPSSDLKVFQPFHRFEYEGHGFILGLAAISEPNSLPVKNISRRAGVTLNIHLQPHFDFDGTGPKVGDVFILILVARDSAIAGKIEEIAIGVIDGGYEQYLYYESFDSYLQGHADAPVDPPPAPPSTAGAAIQLKSRITPFIPPEAPTVEKQTKGETG